MRTLAEPHATGIAEVPHELTADVLAVRRGVSKNLRAGDRVEESLAQSVAGFASLGQDLSVPVSRMTDVLTQIRGSAAQWGVESRLVAHAGDGNIHLLLVGDALDSSGVSPSTHALTSAMHEIVTHALSLGAAVTGEHGVGSLKLDWAAQDLGEPVLEMQRAIKHALDPQGLMNPGKLYGYPS